MTVDPAPTKEAITGSLSRSWASWFNQVYAAVSSLISQFGTLSNSLTTLQGTVSTQGSSITALQGTTASQGSSITTLQTGGTLTNPTLAGTVTISTASTLSIGSNWVSYTQTITPSGSMTITGSTVFEYEYFRVGALCFFRISANLTLGGTMSNFVSFSLPFSNPVNAYASCSAFVGGNVAFAQVVASGSTVQVYPNGLGVYSAGTYYFSVSGFYRCA